MSAEGEGQVALGCLVLTVGAVVLIVGGYIAIHFLAKVW